MGESLRGFVHLDQDIRCHQTSSCSLLQSRDCFCSEVGFIICILLSFYLKLVCTINRCADIDLNLDGNMLMRQPSVAEADPFLAFSSEDLAGMDKEVEDILSGESDSDSDGEGGDNDCLGNGDDGSSSEDSLTGISRGHKRKLETIQENEGDDEEEESNLEAPSSKFKKGEEVPSDFEVDQASDDSGDDIDGEEGGDWSLMGAALEKELE